MTSCAADRRLDDLSQPGRRADGVRGRGQAPPPGRARVRPGGSALGVADGRTGDDGRARRRRPGDGHRPALGPAGGECRVRERHGLPRARLRRHALRLGRARDRRHGPGRPWPVGEAVGARGGDVLAALVGANEIVTRVGMAASGLFHERGFHPTAVCGVFGAATAAARLDGLDEERTASALGIAGSLASGIFAYLEDGTPTKPIHPAWAAHGAVLGGPARRARRGGPAERLRGPLRPLPLLPRRREGRDRPGRATGRPRLALGDAADRVQAVSGLPLHARLARGRRRGGRRDSPPTRSRTCSSRCRRRASRSSSSRRRRRPLRAASTRPSSASSIRPRR